MGTGALGDNVKTNMDAFIATLTTVQKNAFTDAIRKSMMETMFNAVEDWVYNPTLTIDSATLATAIQTLPHGLGARPNYVKVSLLCSTAELGFAQGDEIFKFAEQDVRPFQVVADATNFKTFISASVPLVLRKDTGAGAVITVANWKFRIRYRLN